MNVIDFGQARLQEGREAVGRLSQQRTLGGVRTGYRRARTSLPDCAREVAERTELRGRRPEGARPD